ncbi:MAG: hypothetical protein KDD82_31645 [Planctomycetes bacterium]|nr:hypothetical protein [Planctomycetota bacterium]
MLTRRTPARWGALLLTSLVPALAQSAPPALAEQEPNDEPEATAQTLALGQSFVGTLGTQGAVGDDTDSVWLEFAEPTRVDLSYAPEGGAHAAGTFAVHAPGLQPVEVSLARGAARYSGLTLPAGRYPLQLVTRRVSGVGYTLTLSAAPEAPDAEREPNDPPQAPDSLTLGAPRRGWISHPHFDKDRFRVDVPTDGVYRLELSLPDLQPEGEEVAPPTGRWKLELAPQGEEPRFDYALDDVAGTRAADAAPRSFRFFPVLTAGVHELTLTATRGAVGTPYTLELSAEPPPAPDPALLERGRKAVDRGLRYLIELDLAADRTPYAVGSDACLLLALGEGSGAEALAPGRKQKVGEVLAALAGRVEEVKDLLWRGRAVKRFGDGGLYEQALITLALAECSLAGYAQAKPLCLEGVRYLLAAQITPERTEAYGPLPEDDPNCGGWRYEPNARAGDLSVSGWCLIALFAADVAGVEAPGLQRGVTRALGFVERCGRPTGFAYDTRGKPSSVIQQGIGALSGLLFDQRSSALASSLELLDLHQCAGTQSGWGKDSPFYYWYYATRVHYLRGGAAWRTWRTLTLRQLTARQNADGSWASIRDEARVGSRFATGLAVVVLRLCLGEAPAYLDNELEAF